MNNKNIISKQIFELLFAPYDPVIGIARQFLGSPQQHDLLRQVSYCNINKIDTELINKLVFLEFKIENHSRLRKLVTVQNNTSFFLTNLEIKYLILVKELIETLSEWQYQTLLTNLKLD